jgi:hypothetical protein
MVHQVDFHCKDYQDARSAKHKILGMFIIMQTMNCNLVIHFTEHNTLFVCLSVCLFMFVCSSVCSVVFAGTTVLNLQVVNVHQEVELYTKKTPMLLYYQEICFIFNKNK